MRLKGEVYKKVVRSTLLYRVEYRPTKKTRMYKIIGVEMRTLRCMCEHTLIDRIINDIIWKKGMRHPYRRQDERIKLRWFSHICRRSIYPPMRTCDKIVADDDRVGRRKSWG